MKQSEIGDRIVKMQAQLDRIESLLQGGRQHRSQQTGRYTSEEDQPAQSPEEQPAA